MLANKINFPSIFNRVKSIANNWSTLLRMTIGKKIFSSFLIVILLVSSMSLFTFIQVGQLNAESENILKQSLTDIQLVEDLALDVTNETVAMLRFSFTGDLADAAAFDGHRKFADSRISQLESILSSERAHSILQDIKKEKTSFDAIAVKSIDAKRTNNLEQVGSYMLQLAKPSAVLIEASKQLIQEVKDSIRHKQEQNTKRAEQVQLILVIVSLLVAMISIFISIYISRGVSKPVNRLAAAAAEISNGYLAEADIQVQSDDELRTLANSFNKMKRQLRELISRVSASAERISLSSEQLTAISEQSAEAGNQVAAATSCAAQEAATQLSTIDETVSIVERLSTAAGEIASTTSAVAERSSQTAQTATAGTAVIEKAVLQMAQIEHTVSTAASVVGELGKRSHEIGQIVETISSIAGQTNLLALNAAIEAARAGEQGKGFAVVAEEVRKLAVQSHEAAQRVTQLVREIQFDTAKAIQAISIGTNETLSGAAAVDTAGKAFQEIAELVSDVSSQVNTISESIQHMANGNQQIVSSVLSIRSRSKKVAEEAETVSSATEEQSASSEEIAASSQSLAEMARDLKEAVSTFRT